ncbi:MAG: DUF3107 domain-containing protein [Acidimicrobiales bacterium]
MDVRIGISNVARELNLEVPDENAATVKADVDAALSGEASILWITDRDGKQIGVPTAGLAYVELGSPTGGRRIGFAAE